MTWLIWRQHRVQFVLAAAIAALLAVPIAVTGRHLADSVTACRAGHSCGGLFQNYSAMDTIINLTVMVPLVIGIFLGATMVGRELETGTTTLVWSQSVTRRHWLSVKLVTLFVFTVVCGAADAALVTWWSGAHNTVVESRFNGLQFDIQGLAPLGYSLFASALGLAAGVLWRRVLPAMATTVAGFVVVRLVVELALRWHYRPALASLTPMGQPQMRSVGEWVRSTDLVLHGKVISGPLPGNLCGSGPRAASDACMNRLGYRLRTVYQPAGRYWTFQWIEFAIFAGLALLLVGVAIVALRRQDS